MTTLYLHIGVHRTATSSLQTFLRGNNAALKAHHMMLPFGVKRHDKLFRKLFSPIGSVSQTTNELAERAAKKNTPVNAVILTDEDISMHRDLSKLKGFQKQFDVKVIMYVRRQDVWLESWYLQNVKWQWDKKLAHLRFDEFMDRIDDFHWIDYDRYTAMIENVFGEGSLSLGVFERDQMPDGIYADFCRRIGIDDISGFEISKSRNESLLPSVSEFMRQLPLDEIPARYRTIISRACIELNAEYAASRTGADVSPYLLDHRQRTAVLDRFAEGNRNVAQRYFGRDQLFFDPLPDRTAPIAKVDLPKDSDALMKTFVGPFIRNLYKELESRDQK